jgi:hypothetical protein
LNEDRILAYEERENSCKIEGIKPGEIDRLVFTIKVSDRKLSISYGKKYKIMHKCITELAVDNWGYYGYFGFTARN